MTDMVPVRITGVVRSAGEGSSRGERFFIELAEIALAKEPVAAG